MRIVDPLDEFTFFIYRDALELVEFTSREFVDRTWRFLRKFILGRHVSLTRIGSNAERIDFDYEHSRFRLWGQVFQVFAVHCKPSRSSARFAHREPEVY